MIDILLAAYNGEKYIEEQLKSVLEQTCEDFTLRIRDDCSADRTPDIIRSYAKRNPKKIVFTQGEKNSGSPSEAFFKLLSTSTGDYVMFCDQDDVWFKDKAALCLEEMLKAENKYGRAVPILLHTDLQVTDEGLKTIAPSMFAYQRLDCKSTQVNKLAVQNIVTGCTVMINRALADRLKHGPKSVPVHDWWIALYAACCGKIIFLDKPTLYYRQHGKNACGAVDMRDAGYFSARLKNGAKARLMMKYTYLIAAEMAEEYGESLGSENYALLKSYGELLNAPYLKKLKFITRHKMLKDGLIRRLGQLIYM